MGISSHAARIGLKLIGKFNSSLKYKFVAYFLLLSVLPIMLLGSISYVIMTDILEDKAVKNSINFAGSQMSNFDNANKYFEMLLYDITTSDITQQYLVLMNRPDMDIFEFDHTLTRLGTKLDSIMIQKNDVVESILFLWEDGTSPLARGTPDIDYFSDYRKLDVYKRTIANEYKTVWTFGGGAGEDGKHVLYISRTLNEVFSMRKKGIVIVTLNMNYFNENFQNPNLEKGERTLLVNEGGTLLFDSDASGLGIEYENREVLQAVAGTASGSFNIHIGGASHIVTYATSKINGWKLINLIPRKNVMEAIAGVPRVAILITLICVFYSLLIAGFVYMSLYKPIDKLTRAVNKFGDGDLEVRVASRRTDELGKLSDNFNEMTDRIKRLIGNIELEQKNKKESDIKALQAQIMPHFLYNTLNAVKALARMGRNEDIIQMVVALIKLLRVSISNSRDFISIGEELEYVRSYVKIMEFRYDRQMKVVFHVEEGLEACGIQKFTVQPLVENCILHAFNEVSKDCTITISVAKQENDIVLSVMDNGIGMDGQTAHAMLQRDRSSSRIQFSGIGLVNINERIKLNFGDRYGIWFESEVGQGTTAYVQLPCLELE